jgi:hypothetical protein
MKIWMSRAKEDDPMNPKDIKPAMPGAEPSAWNELV